MKFPKSPAFLFSLIIMTLLLAVIPEAALGQGRGHGRGGIFGDSHNKCGKFVNCHDARDGRWDGRGPRGTQVGNLVGRNRFRTRRYRDSNNDRFVIRNRKMRHNYWRNR